MMAHPRVPRRFDQLTSAPLEASFKEYGPGMMPSVAKRRNIASIRWAAAWRHVKSPGHHRQECADNLLNAKSPRDNVADFLSTVAAKSRRNAGVIESLAIDLKT